jgi:threonine aldolase
MKKITFLASDNYSGVHPNVMQAIQDVNHGSAIAYGNDEYTQQAINLFRQHFGEQVDVYFVFNGTGANIISLRALVNSYNAIICAESAHINVHECGAIENQSGAKLLLVPTENGKITVDGIAQ